jgi:hypothetical protein
VNRGRSSTAGWTALTTSDQQLLVKTLSRRVRSSTTPPRADHLAIVVPDFLPCRPHSGQRVKHRTTSAAWNAAQLEMAKRMQSECPFFASTAIAIMSWLFLWFVEGEVLCASLGEDPFKISPARKGTGTEERCFGRGEHKSFVNVTMCGRPHCFEKQGHDASHFSR